MFQGILGATCARSGRSYAPRLNPLRTHFPFYPYYRTNLAGRFHSTEVDFRKRVRIGGGKRKVSDTWRDPSLTLPARALDQIQRSAATASLRSSSPAPSAPLSRT